MAEELAALNLEVYDGREGLWHPEHGDVVQPEGWEFLPSGDAFVTRAVKAAGIYWTLWRPRGQGRDHRRKLGLLAPSATIAAAKVLATETAERRVGQRVAGARHRERVETAYHAEFEAAVVSWLAFAPEHAGLAEEIARGAAGQAVAVGSGRVGRTKMLPLEERAALAARAFIRHRFTDYEAHLPPIDLDDERYRVVKRRAHAAVDEFLDHHRSATN